LLKPFLRRLRSYFQADILAELHLLRAEILRREDFDPVLRQMESALLTIALHNEAQAHSQARTPPEDTRSGD
jgi:hypothetical protein